VSDRLGYGSAPFASVMRRINDVTFAKGLRCNGKTGVDTALNAVLELYAGKLARTVLRGPRCREVVGLPTKRMAACNGLHRGSRFALIRKGADFRVVQLSQVHI
jgi:hypothetical protein